MPPQRERSPEFTSEEMPLIKHPSKYVEDLIAEFDSCLNLIKGFPGQDKSKTCKVLERRITSLKKDEEDLCQAWEKYEALPSEKKAGRNNEFDHYERRMRRVIDKMKGDIRSELFKNLSESNKEKRKALDNELCEKIRGIYQINQGNTNSKGGSGAKNAMATLIHNLDTDKIQENKPKKSEKLENTAQEESRSRRGDDKDRRGVDTKKRENSQQRRGRKDDKGSSSKRNTSRR